MLCFICAEGKRRASEAVLPVRIALPAPELSPAHVQERKSLLQNRMILKRIKIFKERVSASMQTESADPRESYITMDHFAVARIEEKKSVFHGWAGPVQTEQEASVLIEKAKRQYPDAKHHVYAWIIGGILQRNKYSDDGEPGGTAGLPVLDVLRKNRIEDGILLVTRYFGGTLLGTGGLVRAYTSAAMNALKASEPVTMRRCQTFELKTTYAGLEKIRRTLPDSSMTLEVTGYGDVVTAMVICPESKKDALIRSIADSSNGRASLDFIGTTYQKSEFLAL